ncbi:MAG: hypothetical protein Q9209_000895 [Squamulea sp. 1 TL-2023]
MEQDGPITSFAEAAELLVREHNLDRYSLPRRDTPQQHPNPNIERPPNPSNGLQTRYSTQRGAIVITDKPSPDPSRYRRSQQPLPDSPGYASPSRPLPTRPGASKASIETKESPRRASVRDIQVDGLAHTPWHGYKIPKELGILQPNVPDEIRGIIKKSLDEQRAIMLSRLQAPQIVVRTATDTHHESHPADADPMVAESSATASNRHARSPRPVSERTRSTYPSIRQQVSGLAPLGRNIKHHFPPKCCLQEIPKEVLRKYIEAKELASFDDKALGYAVAIGSRYCCSRPECARWIDTIKAQPQNEALECPHCSSSICTKSSVTHAVLDGTPALAQKKTKPNELAKFVRTSKDSKPRLEYTKIQGLRKIHATEVIQTRTRHGHDEDAILLKITETSDHNEDEVDPATQLEALFSAQELERSALRWIQARGIGK